MDEFVFGPPAPCLTRQAQLRKFERVAYPSLAVSPTLRRALDTSNKNDTKSENEIRTRIRTAFAQQPLANRNKNQYKLFNIGRDVYYRRAKRIGFRARSAFKLIQLDERYDLFRDDDDDDGSNSLAVDLCAAPGSWSQVLVQKIYIDKNIPIPQPTFDKDSTLMKKQDQRVQVLGESASLWSSAHGEDTRIVAVDLQEIAPLPGVHIIQGDLASAEIANKVVAAFYGRQCGLCVCDGAPDVSGWHDLDEHIHSQLLLAAFNISTFLMRPGASFVAKFFFGKSYNLLESQMRLFFDNVKVFKPSSSRVRSSEHFIVCKSFKLPESYIPSFVSSSNYAKPSWPNGASALRSYIAVGDLDCQTT